MDAKRQVDKMTEGMNLTKEEKENMYKKEADALLQAYIDSHKQRR